MMIRDPAANLRPIKTFGFLLAVFGTSFSISICGIGLGIYVGAMILTAMLDRQYEWRPYPAWRFLVPLLASLAVSTVISDYRWVSLRGFGKYLEGFLLLYAGIDVVRSEKDKKALIFALAAAYGLAAADGVYQKLAGMDLLHGHLINIYVDGVMRLTGPFKHCNDFGTFLVPGLVISLALALDLMRRKKWAASVLWFALLAVLGWALVNTLSRGAILAAFAALFFFCLFFRARRHAVLPVAGTLALLWTIPSPLRDRLHELSSLKAGNMPERILLLKTSLRMIAEGPVFGLGLNTYSDNFPKFKPPDYPAHMYAHNSYLQMATESGVLGVALLLAFIVAVMLRCRKKLVGRQDGDSFKIFGAALLAGAFGILVNGLFDSVLQSTQLRTLFWSLAGVALAIASL